MAELLFTQEDFLSFKMLEGACLTSFGEEYALLLPCTTISLRAIRCMASKNKILVSLLGN